VGDSVDRQRRPFPFRDGPIIHPRSKAIATFPQPVSKSSMRTLFWCVLLTSLAGVGVAAQDKPDFSGRWVLQDPAKPGADVPRTLVVRQPLRTATALGVPMPPVFIDISVERRFETGVRTDTYDIGTEAGTVSGQGVSPPDAFHPSTRVSVKWEGDRLRIDTASYTTPTRDSGPVAEHSEVWRLETQDRLVITVVDPRDRIEPPMRMLTYRRE
jgi:hypothetical protein